MRLACDEEWRGRDKGVTVLYLSPLYYHHHNHDKAN